jgi:DNA-binding response OmpR family regulator
MSRILLIDDEDSVRVPLAAVLRRAGFEVVTAADGKEGIAVFRHSPVDLVITDLIMPKQDGFETIKTIRRLQPGAKIIAISGGDRAITAKYLQTVAQRREADRILTKPFTGQEFVTAVKEVLCSGPT